MPSGKTRTYRVTFTVVVDVEAHDEDKARDGAWNAIDAVRDDAFIESVEDLGGTEWDDTLAPNIRIGQRVQDGWLWTTDQESYLHAATLGEALEAVADQTADEWGGSGWAEVYRARRIDLASVAPSIAEEAIRTMANGDLETAYVECPEEIRDRTNALARAFAADIERVCGPWHEVLGKVVIELSFEDSVIVRLNGPAADEAHALGRAMGSSIDGGYDV